MKICCKCKITKPISEFYWSKKDGLEYRCKSCKREYAQSHKAEIAERMQKYQQTRKVECAKLSQEYRQRNPEKCKARSVISVAVKTRELFASIFCEICGLSIKTEAHHPDYSRPLEVSWLCRKCHSKTHNEGVLV